MSIDITPCAKLFDLEEARQLLPLIKTITRKHQDELAPIQLRLNKMLSNDPRRSTIEAEYEVVVRTWRAKIEKLGATVFGLWVVEFDVGEGALCWRHPELTLNYFRPRQSDFAGRIRLKDYIEAQDPDWAHH